MLNIKGHLLSLDKPIVMAIINVTPDSFFAESRQNIDSLEDAIEKSLREGATILDIGGCSTRPNSIPATEEEEWNRLDETLTKITEKYPQALLSIDTFRSQIAERVVRKFGQVIINDISGGDEQMYKVAAENLCPYVLTFNKTYESLSKVVGFFQEKIDQLHRLGVKDIILDPGFGFAKSIEQNYELLKHLDILQIFQLPILVGVSRKSMIFKVLNSSPQESLTGTIALNSMALLKGASILRVHDVKEAIDTIQICGLLK